MKQFDFLTDDEKSLLALYLKRITFDDALRRVDGGSKEEEKAMAYRILNVIEKLQEELANQGFSPR
jgi:hypothetical protein